MENAFELRDAIKHVAFDHEWMTHFQMLVVAELMGPKEAEEFYFSELKRGKRIKDMDPALVHGWALHVAALRLICQDPETIRAELAELREAREAADGKPEYLFVLGRTADGKLLPLRSDNPARVSQWYGILGGLVEEAIWEIEDAKEEAADTARRERVENINDLWEKVDKLVEEMREENK